MSFRSEHPQEWISHGLRFMHIDTTSRLADELARLGADPAAAKIIEGKTNLLAIRVDGINEVTANILKTEMLATGAEAALPHDVYFMLGKRSKAIIYGSNDQITKVCTKLNAYGGELQLLAQSIQRLLSVVSNSSRKFKHRTGAFDLSKGTVIFGIWNVTPDSFSDGGIYNEPSAGKKHALNMLAQGAHVIDIGGQSSRPYAKSVSARVELERTIPYIKELRSSRKCVISIDTEKAAIASEAMDAGVDIINDITGFRDPHMRDIAAQHGAGCIVMHMQGTPRTMQRSPHYSDIIGEIYEFLDRRTALLIKTGIKRDHIAIDPGIGFGKTAEHNMVILNRLSEFRSLGFPVFVGTSRKAFIGKIEGTEASDRIAGTIASNLVAIKNGADMIRVHDVKEVSRAVKLAEAIFKTG